ncbi:hypothetical protein [Rathayibacter sp. PhB151]|uniref:hypothetical protein n=1 Tax=Rathayibacter sp. PhB151 TaxID=2485189 RepID=UPI001062FDEB|nr:hypothetical protein [Rathayibacter sp. PhB151]
MEKSGRLFYALVPYLGWFVVGFSWLVVARAVAIMHHINRYLSGFLLVLGLCLVAGRRIESTS